MTATTEDLYIVLSAISDQLAAVHATLREMQRDQNEWMRELLNEVGRLTD